MKKKCFFGIYLLLCIGITIGLTFLMVNFIQHSVVNVITNADTTPFHINTRIYGLGRSGNLTNNVQVHYEVAIAKSDGDRDNGQEIYVNNCSLSNNEVKIDANVDARWGLIWTRRALKVEEITLLSSSTSRLYSVSRVDLSFVHDDGGNAWAQSSITLNSFYYGDSDDWKRGSNWTASIYFTIQCAINNQSGSGSSSVRFNTATNSVTTSLTRPTRIGYTFKGYYTAINGGGVQVIDENLNWKWAISDCYPTTLYAKWEPNTYTVKLNQNGGSDGTTSVTAAYNSTMPSITIPARTGYKFLGYYDTSTTSGGTQYYKSTGASARTWNKTSNTTLFARWELIDYKISYTLNGGNYGTYHPTTATYNDVINISNPTRTGYTFKGWSASGLSNTAMTGTSSSLSKWDGKLTKNTYFANLITRDNGTVTLSAQWQINNIKATLRRNYFKNDETTIGSPPSSNYVSTGTTFNNLPSPTREGYNFIGWNTKDDGSGRYYKSSTNFNDLTQVEAGHCVATANAGNIEFTLYAIWEANDYKINYNLAGGSHGSSHPTTAKYDSVVNISNPTKVGYTFTGWSATTSSGLNTTTAKAGTSNSLSALKTWNGSATKNTYFANLTAIDNRTVTLTANWTANTYTINYSLGDNTSFPATLGSKAPKSATYDISIEISTPTREGYVFAGWTLSGDDISTAQSGASSTSLTAWDGGANRNRYFKNLTPDASGSVTMKATWQATIASSITATMPAKDSNNEYYLINNINNLAWLALQGDKASVAGKFRQTNNITIPNNILWLPIGRLGSFSGTYDGQGYAISRLSSYNGTDANRNYLETNGGLFANAGGAKIKNVIIEDAEIYGQNAGIIAGSGNASTKISNCVVSGTVNGTNAGSIIGNGNGASIITACLAKGVNTASFAGGSASVDSCIYELNDPSKTRGRSSTFTKYSAWIYPSNFAYPMPKAFMWYPGAELSADSLNKWLGIA